MHFPVEIHIGRTALPLHAITETLGIFTGFRYFLYLRRQQEDHIHTNNRIWIILGAIFGAVIGSRLVGGLENPQAMLHSGNVLLYFYQNKTVVGGFLGGLMGVEIVKLVIGEKQSSGDLFTYPMILALIIGRIGCFTMGVYEETYGLPTQLPWGMDLGDGIRRHPVNLYEIIFLLLLWMVILAVERRYVLVSGARFKLFMIAYLLFRFCLDFIKPHYFSIIPFSTIQLACLAGLLYYSKSIVHPGKLVSYSRKNSFQIKRGTAN